MMYNRRDLLRWGAAATAGLAATLVPARATAASPLRPAPAPPPVDEAAWRALGRALGPGADLYRPHGNAYTRLSTPWNLRYADVLPAGVVACATSADVQAALRWATAHGMPLAARSGGHNYAGYSTTTGLLISLRRIDGVRARDRRLLVGGGATNSDVYRARASGLYFPGGRCPGVGVAGLALGGGLGFNDRRWGLTCDRMVETEVVLADGSLVRASEREHADLWWACRGGAGGNFGINTSFVFDAVPVTDQTATVFDLTIDPRHAVAVMDAVQEILQQDRAGRFDCRIGFSRSGTDPASITLLGQYLGTEATTRHLLAPLLNLAPSRRFIEQRQFWSAQDYLMMRPERTAMISHSLMPGRWLPDRTVRTIAEAVTDWQPGGSGTGGYVTLFAMGGRVGDVAPRETAFAHRDATFVIDIGAEWTPATPRETARRLRRQAGAVYRRLRTELDTSSAYVNFPDPTLSDWARAYYGDNYQRLVRIKHRYDPDGVFRYGQSIGSSNR
ncbi:FAD-binding oxidoreductase [Planomonospora sp. ID67723]|uniref:FAD-binding oxidoreductase n=1 Tax=Planomonospora sp. ID67723 TaxID=2738134 RepID=UPI0018C3973F|nr:FAD-binding oxidoreductase [Planomonospora sp. ID67723]MBG0827387.1 FAD-binding oxidoreductase [Planomonospora sp. ID67723]